MSDAARASFRRFVGGAAAPAAAPTLVRLDLLDPEEQLPLVVSPLDPDVDLVSWTRAHRDWVEERLLEHGGILFRGFPVGGEEGFAAFVRALADELSEYVDQHTPRSAVGDRLYTSTEYPAEHPIELHSEMSYSSSWPRKIWFWCEHPAEEGGETPIADNRRVVAALDPEVRSRFERHGVTYVRTFGEGVGLTWRQAFQVDSRERLEELCRREGVELEWLGDERVTTRRTGPATLAHPVSGEAVWFNQAHAFHPSSLRPEVRASLEATLGPDGFPNDARYGDSSPIPDADVAAVRAAYAQVAVAFPWRRDDVLLLDNVLVAHGRNPFRGERRILVAMAEPDRERA